MRALIFSLLILASPVKAMGDAPNIRKFTFNPSEIARDVDALPDDLRQTYSQFFSVSVDFSEKSIKKFQLLREGIYFIHAEYVPNLPDMSEKVFKNSALERHLLATIDVKSKTIKNLDSSKWPDLGGDSALAKGLSYSGRDGNMVYGCQLDSPIRQQDIDGDGIAEIIFLGGIGEFYSDQNGRGVDVSVKTTIRIFKLAGSDLEQIFSTELSVENYGSEFFSEENGISNPGFQSFSNFLFEGDKRVYVRNGVQGRRRYSKLYFSDFNENGKLDVIVKTVNFSSRKISDPQKGFKLEGIELTMHEIASGSFTKLSVPQDTLEIYLTKVNANWGSGWPNRNLCEGYGFIGGEAKNYSIDDPLIIDYTNLPIHQLDPFE